MNAEGAADEAEYRGQRYRRLGREPWVRKDGSTTTISLWSSNCATCGAPFECTSPDEAEYFHPARHCAAHRRPRSTWRSQAAVTDPATIEPVTWPIREFAPVEAYDQDEARK